MSSNEDDYIYVLDLDAESEEESDSAPQDIDTDDEKDERSSGGEPPTRPRHFYTPQNEPHKFPPNTANRMKNVLKFMKDNDFPSVAMFMNAFLWGESSCTADATIRDERTRFALSPELPIILRNLANPPGVAESSQQPVREFVLEYAQSAVRDDMDLIAEDFMVPAGQDPLSVETLTSLDFSELSGNLEKKSLFLWPLLMAAGWSDEQAKRNTHKTPRNVIMNILSMLSYTRSHKRNRVASLWAIFLKTCGLNSRAYDALHAAGFVMSIKWTNDAFDIIAKKQIETMKRLILTHCWLLAYDNCQIAKRVFSMRITNQPMFHSACAGTVYIFPEHIIFPKQLVHEQHAQRIRGSEVPFDLNSVFLGTWPGARAQSERIKKRNVWRIVQTLLDSPHFSKYSKEQRSHPILSKPRPVSELPADPDNAVKQFMLKTENIEEASYDGNKKVLTAFLKQLGISSPAELRSMAEDKLVFTAGDQLTIERLEGLKRICHGNVNGYDRYDWVFPVFGWFHLVMAFANSLYTQYSGTTTGHGLRRAFELMVRMKGLNKIKTQGPFWHHLDEALHHILESHLLALWRTVAGVEDLSLLCQKSPEELYALAEDIHTHHVSRKAWGAKKKGQDKDGDAVRKQALMFIHDTLPYVNLRDDIKHGNVGGMEDLLPTLAQRFSGGGSPKYTILVLELLQGLNQEWTLETKNFVRQHCWLTNRQGKRDSFLPIDEDQEHNIGDIKVTYRSSGPSADIVQIGKLSPAIPVFRAIRNSMKWQHQLILSRGSKHTAPSRTGDVARLTEFLLKEKCFEHTPGRAIKHPNDQVKDVLSLGVKNLFGGQFDRWWDHRDYARETLQLWPEQSAASGGGEGSERAVA